MLDQRGGVTVSGMENFRSIASGTLLPASFKRGPGEAISAKIGVLSSTRGASTCRAAISIRVPFIRRRVRSASTPDEINLHRRMLDGRGIARLKRAASGRPEPPSRASSVFDAGFRGRRSSAAMRAARSLMVFSLHRSKTTPVRNAPFNAVPGIYGPVGDSAKVGMNRFSAWARSQKGNRACDVRTGCGGRRNSARIRPRKRNPASRLSSAASGTLQARTFGKQSENSALIEHIDMILPDHVIDGREALAIADQRRRQTGEPVFHKEHRGARTRACRVETPRDTSPSRAQASTRVSTRHVKTCATSVTMPSTGSRSRPRTRRGTRDVRNFQVPRPSRRRGFGSRHQIPILPPPSGSAFSRRRSFPHGRCGWLMRNCPAPSRPNRQSPG